MSNDLYSDIIRVICIKVAVSPITFFVVYLKCYYY